MCYDSHTRGGFNICENGAADFQHGSTMAEQGIPGKMELTLTHASTPVPPNHVYCPLS
jgi:hypothetical protein